MMPTLVKEQAPVPPPSSQHAQANHIQSLLDCAQACLTSEDFMLRNSPLQQKACALCADACTRCAASCEQIGKNDAQMQTCAN